MVPVRITRRSRSKFICQILQYVSFHTLPKVREHRKSFVETDIGDKGIYES